MAGTTSPTCEATNTTADWRRDATNARPRATSCAYWRYHPRHEPSAAWRAAAARSCSDIVRRHRRLLSPARGDTHWVWVATHHLVSALKRQDVVRPVWGIQEPLAQRFTADARACPIDEIPQGYATHRWRRYNLEVLECG